jgi:hypothetical protein
LDFFYIEKLVVYRDSYKVAQFEGSGGFMWCLSTDNKDGLFFGLSHFGVTVVKTDEQSFKGLSLLETLYK